MKKENRTLKALHNLLGCGVEEIIGDLPSLGEEGFVCVNFADWRLDGDGTQVVEQVRMDFKRLQSGRVGQWSMSSFDTDDSSPNYGEERITTGKGQW
jgi:hypothetical protein